MQFFDNTAVVIPFVPDGRAEISCTLSWDSEITSSLRGNEGRGGYRALPRPKLVFTARTCSAAQTADLRARLLRAFDLNDPQSGGLGRVAVPWQARACWLSQDVAAGAMLLPLKATPWPWQHADGWIAFPDPQSAAAGAGWVFGTTTGIDGAGNLALSAPLPQTLPVGAAIYPLCVGRLEVSGRGGLLTDTCLSQPLTVWGERQFIDPGTVPDCCRVLDGPPPLVDVDFAVVRYQWTNQDGADADTRTLILQPPVPGVIGFAKDFRVPDAPAPAMLTWGQESGQTRTEAVLIDFHAIAAAYPGAVTITIALYAYWFSAPINGMINLQFQTYQGGVMEGPINTDFVNVGGQTVQTINRPRLIDQTINVNLTGYGTPCGLLVYTPATRSAVIIDP